jgi:hypothetical protein
MAQITKTQRIERIKELLDELNKMPPERHEVARLPGSGQDPLLCQVIQLGVDEVLLNHHSHRIRSQLEDDPEWQKLKSDPQTEVAQKVIAKHVKAARDLDQFNSLKESLLSEGQTDPGVISHDGVLINANTRVAAIREFEDPSRRYIRVAVLPSSTQPEQLALLELRLQMRKELKEDYSLTNELLFIEELSSDRGLSDTQIAKEMRVDPENEKRGAKEVNLRLRFLDLLRRLKKIPSEELALSYFDGRIRYEQLREVHRIHGSLLENDPGEAQRYLESFLLSVGVGVTSVHQIRHVDPRFVRRYMLPQLEEDEVVGNFADALAGGQGAAKSDKSGLMVDEDDEENAIDLKGLIDIATGRDKRVEVPGENFVLKQDEVNEAIRSAMLTGIKEKRRDAKDADKLEAPISAVRTATRELSKASEAIKALAGDDQFDERRKKSLEVAFNKLKRGVRGLEQRLSKEEIIEA